MHSEQYFFCIITATHNAGKDIPDLLESLAKQTCRDFIWIVQDGASTDSTCEILENGREKLPAILIESEPDKGIYDAWNKALHRARSISCRWILFLGADDALTNPEVLRQVRQYLEAAPEGVLYAAAGAQLVGNTFTEDIPGCANNSCQRLRREMPFCHTALFHRSTVFHQAQFDMRYRVLGDYDFICRTLQDDSQVCAVPVTATRMRRGGISTTLCMQPKIFKESCFIAYRNFGKLTKRHARVGVSVLVVLILCVLLGAYKAERIADFLRAIRGKPPVWSNPPFARRVLSEADCGVVLVHYNSPSDTLECLRALETLENSPAYIIVVDNNSCFEDLHALRTGWQALYGHDQRLHEILEQEEGQPTSRMLLALPENRGFAGGNNAALKLLVRHTDCGAFWLLNTDTEPTSTALKALCTRLNEKPAAGACGSTLVYMEAQDTLQTAGGHSFCSWTGRTEMLLKHASLQAVLSLTLCEVERTEHRMRCVSGASCLVRREALEAAGLLPEDYFLYYEDVAFSLNITQKKFSLVWARDSVVFHKEGGSTGAASAGNTHGLIRPAYIDYLSLRNRVAVIRRYNPWALPVVLGSLPIIYLRRALRGQKRCLSLVAKAAWDGLSNRMGIPNLTKWRD